MSTQPRSTTVAPTVPYQLAILKQHNEDGSISYLHPHTKTPVSVRTVEICEFFRDRIFDLQRLVDILSEADYSAFGFIAAALIRDIEAQLDEVKDSLEHDADAHALLVDVVLPRQHSFRDGRVVGVRFEQNETVACN